ncbi:MAG: tyrosine-type recombinase/integrase, partial [Bdellovibrionales bacterium]|nr:tyrosine-type recombinase/integrase [Bdellovibrionales bacterium]
KIPARPLWMDAFYVHCNRAGVKAVSFHALRHTFASAMALYTPPPVLQQMLGHESLTTTMKYVHIAQSDSVGFTEKLKSIYREHRNLEELARLTLRKVS